MVRGRYRTRWISAVFVAEIVLANEPAINENPGIWNEAKSWRRLAGHMVGAAGRSRVVWCNSRAASVASPKIRLCRASGDRRQFMLQMRNIPRSATLSARGHYRTSQISRCEPSCARDGL
jgi:hypothetical protein